MIIVFEEIFSKQVEALGKSGDVLIGITTSGNSPNIVKAFEVAKSMNIKTVAMTGDNYNSKVTILTDMLITVPSNVTAIIQEMHITIGHILCHLIDMQYSK